MRPMLLLAEEDGELSEIYRRFLQRHGYEVETSADGLDCLAKLRRCSPTVLVLGLDILWGGGMGVLAWLREQHGTAMPPVVLIANGAATVSLTELVVPPVVACLQKPVSLAELLASVRSAAAQGRVAVERN